MRATIHLGRLWGIRLGLHWSVLVIVLLLVLGIGAGRFPLVYPGYEGWAYLLAGLVAATLFLLSLLAHEMAHALVARREGRQVEGISLWMLGGLASLRGPSRGPGAEFKVAAAGPVTSVLLGIVFYLRACESTSDLATRTCRGLTFPWGSPTPRHSPAHSTAHRGSPTSQARTASRSGCRRRARPKARW